MCSRLAMALRNGQPGGSQWLATASRCSSSTFMQVCFWVVIGNNSISFSDTECRAVLTASVEAQFRLSDRQVSTPELLDVHSLYDCSGQLVDCLVQGINAHSVLHLLLKNSKNLLCIYGKPAKPAKPAKPIQPSQQAS